MSAQKNANRRTNVEHLESRTLMSGSGLDAAALAAAGFEPMRWRGQQLQAKSGEWIVQLGGKQATAADRLAAACARLGKFGCTEVQSLGGDGTTFLVKAPEGMQAAQLRNKFGNVRGVKFFEPNTALVLPQATMPNDPRFRELYGLNNSGGGGRSDADIDAPEAWDITRGSRGVVVGIIDTGIDYRHPDLAANVWTNPNEVAGNGRDDDGNGYVDDVHGYDFINNDGDPMDDDGHGTHVAGTIAGVGNNGVGVTGVNWQGQVMALKFLGAQGGSLADGIEAINYATMMRQRGVNIRVTNNSWGGGGYSAALRNAIARHNDAGILFAAAAGNDGMDNDFFMSYPASYDVPNIISVAATDSADQLASFSNYGGSTVHLAAPGVDILSTLPGNRYGELSGTSMATPHVSGVAALVAAANPNFTVAQLKNAILNGVDRVSSLNGVVTTGGRLNALGALRGSVGGDPGDPGGPGNPPPPPPPPPGQQQQPYFGSPIAIDPNTGAVIEVEDFDRGGDGVAYGEQSAGNMLGYYRTDEDVDITYTYDGYAEGAWDGEDYRVTHTQSGEWLEYTVNVGRAGTYRFDVRTGAWYDGGAFHVEVDGRDVTGSMSVPVVGSYDELATVSSGGASLSAGTHVIRLAFDANFEFEEYAGTFNWIGVVPLGGGGGGDPVPPAPPAPPLPPSPPPPPPPPAVEQTPWFGVPFATGQKIQAEDFDNGGEGVAFHDADGSNELGEYRDDGPDIRATADAGYGYRVTLTEPGEWLEYTVNVKKAKTYRFDFRAGALEGGGTFHVEVDGEDVTGNMAMPIVRNYDSLRTITRGGVRLSAGTHTIRIAFDTAQPTGGFAGTLNWFRVR